MRSITSFITFILILTGQLALGQSDAVKLVSAASKPQRVNTLPFFEPEKTFILEEPLAAAPGKSPETPVKSEEKEIKTKLEVNESDKRKSKVRVETEKVAKDTKNKPKPVPPKTEIVAAKPRQEPTKTTLPPDSLNLAYVAPPVLDAQEAKGSKTLYFDRQKRRVGKDSQAYYLRKVQLDPETEQPIGKVSDFYVGTGKPRFFGQYRRYVATDEDKNIDYDGECIFYEENGAYTVKNYTKGRLEKETKYSANDLMIAFTEYDLSRHRKRFQERIFNAENQRIGQIDGGYNTSTGYEEAKQQLFYPNGKLKSTRELKNNCPDEKTTLGTETGELYEAYLQDFTCEPSESKWKFFNKSYFAVTHDVTSRSYRIRNEKKEGATGLLSLPISYDFYKKPFEIETIIDISVAKPVGELGIVWEFQDENNYSYLKINLTKQTYEINSVKEGIVQKYMAGIRPQNLSLNGKEIKINFRKEANGWSYSVNGQELSYIKSNNQAVKFDKYPRISLDKTYKTWGIGFYFKANQINESIVLKSLEVKLL